MKTNEELIKKIYSCLSKDQGQIVYVEASWQEIRIDGALSLDDLKHIVFSMMEYYGEVKGVSCRHCGWYHDEGQSFDNEEFQCFNCKTPLVLKKNLIASYSTFYAPKS